MGLLYRHIIIRLMLDGRVYWLLFFFSVRLQIFSMMVYIGPRQIFSPFGGSTPGIPKYEILGLGHLTTNILKSQCYMSIRA